MNIDSADSKTPEEAKAAVLHYINDRLEEWAKWSQQGGRGGIGYPPCSIEYRLMTEGHVVREYEGLKPMPSHPAAEEIEMFITEMAIQHRKMAEVVTYYYLHSGGIRHHARQLHMSPTHFEMLLNLARWWLAGRLSTTPLIKRLMKHRMPLQQLSHEKNEKI